MFIDEKTQNIIHATLDNSVSHGTMRYQDIIPTFMDAIRDTPEYVQLMDQFPAHVQDDKNDDWWESEDAMWLLTELIDTLEQYAPENYTFGTHPGDGSDYGYWKVDSYEGNDITKSIKVKTYNEVPHGDFVKCNMCDAIMLLPCGADKCPSCSKEGYLGWVKENEPETSVQELADKGYIIEPSGKTLKLEDYLSSDVLASFPVKI